MASRGGLKGQRVVDVGSGTGAVAIASAIMGAKSAVATDQAQILHLARENIDSFVSSIAGQAERDTRKQQLQIAELDWGDMEQSRAAGAPFDLVLVSECVLPKLYPLEPLVTAIDQLCGHPGQGQGADPSVSLSAPVH